MITPVTGTLVWYYAICPREAWLMSHQVEPWREFDLLAEGRVNQESHYERSAKDKEISLPGMRLDRVRREDGRIVVSEVKKSSKFLPSARMQLGYYLWRLKLEGLDASGELLVPEERFREVVTLTPELEVEVVEMVRRIEALIKAPNPPAAERIRYCKNCAYAEFCWS